MLTIIIPSTEVFDEGKGEFVYIEDTTLELEHSLASISKWESNWCKPFISKQDKSAEEVIDYIKCMTLNDVKDEIYSCLSKENFKAVNDYISAPMTATYFSDDKNSKPSREVVTSELIYYWMISLNIPFECQNWHLNRLLTLVKVCNVKNAPPKKMSKKQIMSRNAALNAARRQQFNTSG